ncbi:MAG: transcriptional regulator [Gammaproteobacteria bacterium]|nr:transcriptional regulator [Gammaproteobacteria bacterium]MBU1655797.1 transcriptional regulator [Gammaproteobacteria bacterium]MBU1960052.1 transcriptional regulator [Gammaproteobacteria bacterium]
MYHYTECGLPNVWLKNGYKEYETAYGKGIGVHNVDDLHKIIASHLVCYKAAITGAEVRFLRHCLDMSQSQLARIIGVGESSVRNWENHRGKITRPAERMLRVLVHEAIQGDGSVRELVERIANMNRDLLTRIELEERPSGWGMAA